MRSLKLVTAPTAEPLATSDMQGWTGDKAGSIQQLLGELIPRARKFVEDRLRIALLQQTWDLTLDADDVCGRSFIAIPRPPLVSVTWVKTYAAATGAVTTLDASAYRVVSADPPKLGKVVLLDGREWGADVAEYAGMVIRFVAGYGSSGSDVPAPLLTGISELVEFWRRFRGSGTTQTNLRGTSLATAPDVDPIIRRLGQYETWAE